MAEAQRLHLRRHIPQQDLAFRIDTRQVFAIWTERYVVSMRANFSWKRVKLRTVGKVPNMDTTFWQILYPREDSVIWSEGQTARWIRGGVGDLFDGQSTIRMFLPRCYVDLPNLYSSVSAGGEVLSSGRKDDLPKPA